MEATRWSLFLAAAMHSVVETGSPLRYKKYADVFGKSGRSDDFTFLGVERVEPLEH
ncbi:MAG: hypothetical protein ACI8Z5_000318 [Lentimonas sp.]